MSITLPSLSIRQSSIAAETNRLNLVDLLFNSHFSRTEASKYKKLQELTERRMSSMLFVRKTSVPRQSFRITNCSSSYFQKERPVIRPSLREKLSQVRERKTSFDQRRSQSKIRLESLMGKRDSPRVISNEVNYLKNEVMDHLVGIS